MSLQDDYFYLEHHLEGTPYQDALNRIWEAFVDMENEHDELTSIRYHLKETIRIAFRNDGESV